MGESPLRKADRGEGLCGHAHTSFQTAFGLYRCADMPVWKMSEGPAVKIPTLVIITKMEHTCTCRLSGGWHIRQPPKVLGEPVAGSIMLHSGEVVQLSRQSCVEPICRTLPAQNVSKVRSWNSLQINLVLWHLKKLTLWINSMKERLLTRERGLALA